MGINELIETDPRELPGVVRELSDGQGELLLDDARREVWSAPDVHHWKRVGRVFDLLRGQHSLRTIEAEATKAGYSVHAHKQHRRY